MAKIADIEGIGPAYAEKLQKAGVRSVEALLKRAAGAKGRKELSEATGIDSTLILKWANMADLFRIKGVAAQFSELLEAAGVDTIKELRTRNAENLYAKVKEVNDAKKKVRQIPSLKQIQGFIDQAKTMEPSISH
ncbi:MAG: DUF4332 domain-containing protein [Bacteroidetes bacterium]|nr:MAG: DUF4332 domain-containing protein [Bacteroidota bacterium]